MNYEKSDIKAILLQQFDSFDTSSINKKLYIEIQEKLSNDENIYLTVDKNNEFKIIDDSKVNSVNTVFLVFDTLEYQNMSCISCLCIKTKDKSIRDIQKENWIIEHILTHRYLKEENNEVKHKG